MKRCVSITCDFNLAIGKVNLNEIMYLLKELKDSLMLRILKQILISYDDLIINQECFLRHTSWGVKQMTIIRYLQ